MVFTKTNIFLVLLQGNFVCLLSTYHISALSHQAGIIVEPTKNCIKKWYPPAHDNVWFIYPIIPINAYSVKMQRGIHLFGEGVYHNYTPLPPIKSNFVPKGTMKWKKSHRVNQALRNLSATVYFRGKKWCKNYTF